MISKAKVKGKITFPKDEVLRIAWEFISLRYLTVFVWLLRGYSSLF
ncbi:hypothetical protein HJA83_09905 [Rhizobium bangladeshense]|nr:hypothetical protein [Rhizobium bangladeshense]MBX4901648.1 hypothetical protein [Rhizobium bangladeshense]